MPSELSDEFKFVVNRLLRATGILLACFSSVTVVASILDRDPLAETSLYVAATAAGMWLTWANWTPVAVRRTRH